MSTPTYAEIVVGLHERFYTVDGIKKCLDYEPTAIHQTPTIYTLLQRVEKRQHQQVMETRYSILHRLVIKWQDNEHAERDLMAFVDAIPDSVELDPLLKQRIARGIAHVSSGDAGFARIGGTIYRIIDYTSTVIVKRAVQRDLQEA